LLASLSAFVLLGAIAACVGDPFPVADKLDGASDAARGDAGPEESRGDAGPCVGDETFDPPVLVGGINTQGVIDRAAHLSPDQKTIYFASTRASTSGSGLIDRVYFASRSSATDTFSAATILLSDGKNWDNPSVTGDEKTLFVNASRGLAAGSENVQITSRSDPSALFDTPGPVQNVAGPSGSWQPYITPDGSALYYVTGGTIAVAAKQANGFPLSILALPTPSGWSYANPVVSADELTLYFSAHEGQADRGIQVARRKAKPDAFGPPAPVTELNTILPAQPDWISPDKCTLYLTIAHTINPSLDAGAVESHIFRAVRRPR
jgi:hypothetical protein